MAMATSRLVVAQQKQPSSCLLPPSSLSDFNGIRLKHPIQYKRKEWQTRAALQVKASAAKKILIMGGTRFIGIFLSRLLVKEGHQVTLFTRGKAPISQQLPGESEQDYLDYSSKISHLKGDRKDYDFVKTSLAAEGFDVVYDINGREAEEVEPILDALPKLEQYIYCSSAGVYLKSDLLPHFEVDAVDPKSRHKGKLETESLLVSKGVNWTSLRPVYIYGPLNYNPVEEWFFHRLKAGRPIPVPNSGNQITQLGHVKDLATAFIKVLGNAKASQQVFNISGDKYVTFDGLARACAKIGQGTYSNVYKARDTLTGKIVALKKVRFDNFESESVKFMAREILILRRLDHPSVVKLEGLVTSRMSCSLYLVFEYMEHDLAGLAASPDIKFTVPQVKCYMQQLLSGLEHCHNRGVLHRDIKGSNLLLDNGGLLKIADFGLASFFDPNHKHVMTSRVVTLWYRAPELLLGATDYGVGVDLWSAGCILAELLAGKPIMPGRTEVEQLHKIFKLCGSPTEEFWKRSKLPHAAIFKPQQPYKRCIAETFRDFPPSSLPLIETLLAIEPAERLTATAALASEFFTTKPRACEPSSLPQYPPSKEMDAKLRDEEARRVRAAGNKSHAVSVKKTRARERGVRAYPAPEANAELQTNIDRRRLITHSNAKSKSEKFPPPHQDGALGFPLASSHHMEPPEVPYSKTSLIYNQKGPVQTWSGPLVDSTSFGAQRRRRRENKERK